MKTAPVTVTLIEKNDYSRRFRIEGGIVSRKHVEGLGPGEVPSCEIILRNGDDLFLGHAGSAPPLAWPLLLRLEAGLVRPTDIGKSFLDRAEGKPEATLSRGDSMVVMLGKTSYQMVVSTLLLRRDVIDEMIKTALPERLEALRATRADIDAALVDVRNWL